MCRSIVQLRRADAPATEAEVRAAALQFVRKVSGYRAPSRRNAEAFDAAVDEIAAATTRLLTALGQPPLAAIVPDAGESDDAPEIPEFNERRSA